MPVLRYLLHALPPFSPIRAARTAVRLWQAALVGNHSSSAKAPATVKAMSAVMNQPPITVSTPVTR